MLLYVNLPGSCLVVAMWGGGTPSASGSENFGSPASALPRMQRDNGHAVTPGGGERQLPRTSCIGQTPDSLSTQAIHASNRDTHSKSPNLDRLIETTRRA